MKTPDQKQELADCIKRSEWNIFFAGKWKKERPSRPGRYPLASRNGAIYGEIIMGEVVRADSPQGKVVPLNYKDWDGWYWSEPYPALPNLPKPPIWTESEELK